MRGKRQLFVSSSSSAPTFTSTTRAACRWLLGICVSSSLLPTSYALRFGLINSGSDALSPVLTGFRQRCEELGIETVNRTNDLNGTSFEHLDELLNEVGVNGVAMKPSGAEDQKNMTLDLMQTANSMGIPIVFFDSDYENSTRAAYIGTDQSFLGETMARTLRQLRPDGGSFAMIDTKTGRNEGFLDEIFRYNETKGRPQWTIVNMTDEELLEKCPCEGAEKLSQCRRECKMHTYAEMNVTAMIFMKQSPMRLSGEYFGSDYREFIELHRHRNITFIGTDDSDYQLEYLATGYVDGLVGQMPYEFGRTAVNVLLQALADGKPKQEIYGTNLIAHSIIPFDLPDAEVDENLLGYLRVTGFVCFAIAGLLSLVCIFWSIYNRNEIVVKISQPGFLVLLAVGTLILSSSLVPLSFDDGGDPESVSKDYRVAICMSIPWLAFTGFAVMFTALFSKMWRINKIFDKAHPHTKTQVDAKDVLAPLTILLTLNSIVLLIWTLLDPLTYTRTELEGTDYWNRVLATTGQCQSDQVASYLVPLVAINFFALAIACWQAFQARDITSDFSESKYIGLSLASILQTFLTGIPVVAVVRDLPEAFYLITTFMIFVLSVVVLLFIFVPKMIKQYQFSQLSKKDQMIAIKTSIRKTVDQQSGSVSLVAAAGDSSSQVYNSGPFGLGFGSGLHMDRHSGLSSSQGRQNHHSSLGETPSPNSEAPPIDEEK